MHSLLSAQKHGSKCDQFFWQPLHDLFLRPHQILPQTVFMSFCFSVDLQNLSLRKVSHVLHKALIQSCLSFIQPTLFLQDIYGFSIVHTKLSQLSPGKFSPNSAVLKYAQNRLLRVRVPKFELAQAWLLSHVQLNWFLISGRSLLFCLWWSQKLPHQTHLLSSGHQHRVNTWALLQTRSVFYMQVKYHAFYCCFCAKQICCVCSTPVMVMDTYTIQSLVKADLKANCSIQSPMFVHINLNRFC